MNKLLGVLVGCLTLVNTVHAKPFYILYSQVSGTFSVAFTPGNCAGNFDFNHHLLLSVDQIKQNYCQNISCPVALFDGEDCKHKTIATGVTNLETGITKFDNLMPQNYHLIGENYYIGIDARRNF